MSKISIEIFTVDAFTQTPLSGNPAAICILDNYEILQLIHQRFPSDEEKENFYKLIAREMNLSETCFLWRIDSSLDRYKLRWFTPTVEVNLCGHATLASSHLLFNRLGSAVEKLFFETKSGELTVEKEPNTNLLKMNFPQGDPQIIHQQGLGVFEKSTLIELLQNINLIPRSSHHNDMINEIVSEIVLCRKTRKLLIVVKDFSHVLQAEPNEQSLLNMDFKNEDLNTNIKGISISMPISEMSEENKKDLSKLTSDICVNQIDYVTRYFSPWNGLKEDPVNGSSQTSMALYYSTKLNKKKLICFQASKRTGILYVEPIEGGRVSIGGHATTIMHGTMSV